MRTARAAKRWSWQLTTSASGTSSTAESSASCRRRLSQFGKAGRRSSSGRAAKSVRPTNWRNAGFAARIRHWPSRRHDGIGAVRQTSSTSMERGALSSAASSTARRSVSRSRSAVLPIGAGRSHHRIPAGSLSFQRSGSATPGERKSGGSRFASSPSSSSGSTATSGVGQSAVAASPESWSGMRVPSSLRAATRT